MMKVVHMIDHYRKLCQDSWKLGNFEAYRIYTQTYSQLFDAIFQYLYTASIDSLRGLIEWSNFEQILKTAERNYSQGICDHVIAVAQKSAERMKLDFEYELFLGMELSNIGGCSVPRKSQIPYLYIGIDRELTKEMIEILVPHEMVHMIHQQRTEQYEEETLFMRVVEEGLASFAPMWLYHMEWNPENLSRILGITKTDVQILIENMEKIQAMVMRDGEKILTEEMMRKYFMFSDNSSELRLPGYYIGLCLTEQSVRAGASFDDLLSMPSQDIIRFWNSQGLL